MALSPDQLKKYWEAANKLRKNMDAAEYKHIVLGLVFLKYVSDAFEERQAELRALFEGSRTPTRSLLCYWAICVDLVVARSY